jgi:tetratricopeptide (TPR) repeat protein
MVWILANCDSQRAHPKPHFEKRAPIVDWFTKMLLILLAIVSVSSGLTTAHHETLVWLAEDQIYAFRNGKPAVAAPFVAVQRSLGYCMQADGTSLPWNQKRQTRRLADLYGFGSFSLQQQGDARFIKLDQQAELYYRRASQDYAYDAYSWSGLGRFLERNLTEARMSSVTQAYLKAHQLDRFNLNFVLDLSRWYWRLGKYSESLQACEEALKNAPHSEEAQVHRALCLHSLGKSAEAEEAWQQITGLHQGDPLTKPW